MQIESKIFKIKNTKNFSVENIESQLKSYMIIPLRWAIIQLDDKYLYVNTSFEVI